jgi:hypothetical protein
MCNLYRARHETDILRPHGGGSRYGASVL